MNSDHHITGNLINAYYICHRKLWLFSHQINPPVDNFYLDIGRLIGEESYSRSKKEIQAGNLKIDMIENENGKLIIAEIKKSSKGQKPARMQLAFYLYQLKKQRLNLSGELLIPRERKRIKVELTDELESELENAFESMKKIISSEQPPEPHKIGFCRNCAYREFCWI